MTNRFSDVLSNIIIILLLLYLMLVGISCILTPSIRGVKTYFLHTHTMVLTIVSHHQRTSSTSFSFWLFIYHFQHLKYIFYVRIRYINSPFINSICYNESNLASCHWLHFCLLHIAIIYICHNITFCSSPLNMLYFLLWRF